MHFLYDIKAHACSIFVLSSLSLTKEESYWLTIKSPICTVGPFLLVSALRTSSIIAYNLIWTGKWPCGTHIAREREKTGKGGRMRERRRMNSVIIAWLNKRWITHRSVHLSLCMMITYHHTLAPEIASYWIVSTKPELRRNIIFFFFFMFYFVTSV